MTEREILRRAKEVLLERGLGKGVFQNEETGAVCVRGAVGLATKGGDPVLGECTPVGVAAISHLKNTLNVGTKCALSNWNDAEGRTLEEVIDLIDQAIASLPRETRSGQETRHKARLELLEAV